MGDIMYFHYALIQLRVRLREKWNGKVPNVAIGGQKFSLKFPDCSKIDCALLNCTPKVLMYNSAVQAVVSLCTLLFRSCMKLPSLLEAAANLSISTL